jgi:hypothetical protein
VRHASASELAVEAIAVLEDRLQRVHLNHRGGSEGLAPYYLRVP